MTLRDLDTKTTYDRAAQNLPECFGWLVIFESFTGLDFFFIFLNLNRGHQFCEWTIRQTGKGKSKR